MTNLDTVTPRFISNDIINNQPIATYVATSNGTYLETVRYNYFTKKFQHEDNANFSCLNIQWMHEHEAVLTEIEKRIIADISANL